MEVVDEVLELFMDLDASDEQLDCPFIFASAKAGYALKNLEEEGLIRLESAQGDRRSKEVFLTEAGSELAAASVDRVLAIEEQAALRLSPEERLAILALERRQVEALWQEAERFLAENKED